MRIITFGEMTINNGHSLVSISRETNNVVLTLTSEDYLQNVAHTHMTADQARKLAIALIVSAENLDERQ